MKKLGLLMMLLILSRIALFCQPQTAGIEEKEVLKNEDVIFHQIDEHTWFGTGHLMANESLYLVEGDTKAILIDAGTKIKNLDKLVASITDKPVTLVATHVHPDHTGSAIDYFPEIYINPADTVGIPEFMPNYKGKVCFLEDGEILDLGGRILEIVFTPGHTPGSTTFVDMGGESHGESDLKEVVTTAVVNKRAGGMGLISGRKAFQRPMKEGIALLHAVQDVYLDDEVTIA